MELREPYVGQGADGARRSAQIDLEESDTLDPGERRDQCLLSAERWILQAEHLEQQRPPSECGAAIRRDGSGVRCDLPADHHGAHSSGDLSTGHHTWTRGLGSDPTEPESI
jgi:hypothetical protein